MGWNSYDAFGGQVTEGETKACADYMAEHLLRHGWEYCVIDIAWHSNKSMDDWSNREMDDHGRLLPHLERFPSAANGHGFKPLADYVHKLGLKFGIHMMPGITQKAVENNCAILGSKARAVDIILPDSFNPLWPGKLLFLDMRKNGAQAYYDSLLQQYADWGVDFIKADGVGGYLPDQVEALDTARNKCGRDIVLSLSAGCPDYFMWPEHRKIHCEMWRVSEDLWDRWPQVEMMFYNLRAWQDHAGRGHWLDADMLPLGRIGDRQHTDNAPDRDTKLNRNEQRTVITLWCVAQSPLMFGGDLRRMDDWTLSLLTNDEVLAVNQQGIHARELFRDCSVRGVAWMCDLPEPETRAIGLFNFSDKTPNTVTVPFSEAHLPESCRIRDLWTHRDLGMFKGRFAAEIAPHGAGLYRVTPA